jgi:L-threonylcarbamoyladenylate synthase
MLLTQLRFYTNLIHRGEVIAYPTEAVYGLGCDPLNADAVQHLLHIKQRPANKGLILIASDIEQLAPYVQWQDVWLDKVQQSWPGPYTWLLPAAPELPFWINGGRDTLACRVTAHPIAAQLCKAAGQAIISTSANISSRPPARSALQVRLRCPGVQYIVGGKLGELAQPTSIYDARSGQRIR